MEVYCSQPLVSQAVGGKNDQCCGLLGIDCLLGSQYSTIDRQADRV